MEIKPSKSRSISIVKGKLSEHRFYVGEEPIPTVAEKPVKSLGRWYHATLKDSEQVDQLGQYTMSGLESINKDHAPWQAEVVVPSVWATTQIDVASYHLWGPNLKGRKTGKGG